ncbi:MAG TPA: ATP-binding cassette domain-containing protein [Bacteroidales bacterium]|nr:ATP-binding cassette domain-containing protein [Bacteroidales bacterium]
MEIFKADRIEKKFGNFFALNDVSISVPQGSVFGLLGPNGAGKTTLIRIINQITIPDKGTLTFKGRPLKPDDVAHIGYLPEERGLYKKMKAGEQALYLARLRGVPKDTALKKLKEWFEKFDLAPWWDKKIEDLSKGMQQKIQFIVTILHEPELLIFDEPFSGFDPINTNLLKKEILNMKEKGSTIIFSTHNMGSVEELCDYITLINKSKCILEGPISKVRDNYKSNVFELGFTGDEEKLKASLNGNYELSDISAEQGIKKALIKIRNINPEENQLLSSIIDKVHIISFTEVLPDMNEIFIKAVQNANMQLPEEMKVQQK